MKHHEPPQHLDEQAVAKWQEIVVVLETRGDLDAGTLDALTCYCSAWARWTAAEAKVSELGAVVKSAAGFAVANPYVGIAKDAQRQMRQWAAELKITPKSRGKAMSADKESAVALILRQMDQNQDEEAA